MLGVGMQNEQPLLVHFKDKLVPVPALLRIIRAVVMQSLTNVVTSATLVLEGWREVKRAF